MKIDTFICTTGYSYSFPFFKEEDGLVKVTCRNKYIDSLYKRIWCVSEPDLMFVGTHDETVLLMSIIEKQAMAVKYFVQGKIKLPSKEEM